jgi:hypothetical protein
MSLLIVEERPDIDHVQISVPFFGNPDPCVTLACRGRKRLGWILAVGYKYLLCPQPT